MILDNFFRLTIRRLHGCIKSGDINSIVTVRAYTNDLLLYEYQTLPCLDGVWDEMITVPLNVNHVHKVSFQLCGGRERIVDLRERRYGGVEKILLRVGDKDEDDTRPDHNNYYSPYAPIIKQVERGIWEKIDWLDEISFDTIARDELLYAVENDLLFSLVDFPIIDNHIKVSELEGLARLTREGGNMDELFVDCSGTRPLPHQPIPGADELIKPSPRSIQTIRLLSREGALSLPPDNAGLPGILWRYRDWIVRSSKNVRLLCWHIRSVDWVDREEVVLVKRGLEGLKMEFENDPHVVLTSIGCCLMDRNQSVFDPELALILENGLQHGSSLIISYTACLLLSRINGEFKECRRVLQDRLKAYCDQSLYASMAANWFGLATADTDLDDQRKLIEAVHDLLKKQSQVKNRREKKRRLVEMLSDSRRGLMSPFMTTNPRLPTEPSIRVNGVIPDRTTVYKSTAMPVKIAFMGVDDCREHAVIIKLGEDLHGDLMVMQMIRLFDIIWQANGLELNPKTYSVYPIKNGGWLEFVPSVSLSAILREHGTLLKYLNTPKSKQNFVNSCAAYCTITFVLGVGDRHLENLLLTQDGCLFHVDYTYRFGADPKPFPPPMKLCREMVEAMIGDFEAFRVLTLKAYQMLRLNSGYILDFLSLHTDCVGSDNLCFVKERLAVGKSDQEALQWMNNLIDESVNAMFPQVMETIHKWAQYWKN